MNEFLKKIYIAIYAPGYAAARILRKADGMPTISELITLLNGGCI